MFGIRPTRLCQRAASDSGIKQRPRQPDIVIGDVIREHRGRDRRHPPGRAESIARGILQRLKKGQAGRLMRGPFGPSLELLSSYTRLSAGFWGVVDTVRRARVIQRRIPGWGADHLLGLVSTKRAPHDS
jgi:hypothetical protein